MVKGRKNSTIGDDNIAAREKGVLMVRDFEHLVQTFNKVLRYKEKIGKALEESRADLKEKIRVNLDNLEILAGNIEIYNKNIEKIAANLAHLDQEERKFKDQYERLLRGATGEIFSSDDASLEQPTNAPGQESGTREYLISRRQNFLDNLSKRFKDLDDELLSIEGLRKELTRTRAEIDAKKGKAAAKQENLEEKRKRLAEEERRVDKELEKSVEEEEILVDEFSKLLGRVENCIQLSDQIDHVLFSSLTAANTPDGSFQGGNDSNENPG
ncbi:MAG: hypothetical protein ACE5E9_05820 [Nitrospinaceae bacterium]